MGQIVLVRHGQASWGAADYDVLSETGERQSAAVGAAVESLAPRVVVHGTLQRQVRTAEIMLKAAAWPLEPVVDARWDEMDHLAVLAAQPRPFDGEPDRQQFQAWFEAATTRWQSGEHDSDYPEPWTSFRLRVLAGFEALADNGTVVVVTSGGPISVVVAELLDSAAAYERIAPVVINASVTRVVTGRRGRTLVSFNEHLHLAGDLLTYR